MSVGLCRSAWRNPPPRRRSVELLLASWFDDTSTKGLPAVLPIEGETPQTILGRVPAPANGQCSWQDSLGVRCTAPEHSSPECSPPPARPVAVMVMTMYVSRALSLGVAKSTTPEEVCQVAPCLGSMIHRPSTFPRCYLSKERLRKRYQVMSQLQPMGSVPDQIH